MGGRKMRFLVFGDSKGKNKKGINEKVLKSILHESCKLNPLPEFIVVTGDSIAGSNKESILKSQLNNFRSILNSYYPKKLILPVIGNHEVNITPQHDRYELIFKEVYDDFMPSGYLDEYNKSAYYVDFKATRLIILNSFHYNEIHQITNNQLKWFDKIAADDKKNKILFVHSPAFPTGAHLGHCLDLYPNCRDKFWQVVEKNNIDLVISGHEHNYSRRIIPGYKVPQIISGGGGEKLRNKYKDKKGVIIPPIDKFHFLVVDINDNCIKITSISNKGIILDSFIIDKS